MATNTAASFTNHTGNGSAGPFSISFSYLSEAEVDVTVGGVLKTITTHYTFTSATQITFTSGNEPGSGVAIKFQRDTNISAKKVDFQDGSVLTETDLDTNADQVLFAQQEIIDKLSGIEENATADQTNAEIRAAVEAATDSNVFTDADHSKLNAIEASATADQTASEIRTLVESASDSNVFTDADHSKLNAIEASATADQTAAEIRTLVESATDSNVFTDADHTKLNAIEASATADQTGAEIKSAYEGESNTNAFTDAEKTKLSGVEASATADQTASEIRTLVESASDSNVFTDADHTKLNAIEASADVTDATNVDAAGAVMNSDLDTKGEILVGDGSGDPTALSVGTNNYVLTADSSEATGVKWAAAQGGGGGGGISNVVEDTTPQLGGSLDVNGQDIVSTSNADIDLDPNGSGKVVAKGNATRGSGQLKLNCEQNSHGVIIKGPPHSAAQDYTLTLPSSIVNGQFLKTDSSGNLSWAAADVTALSASNLTSGTVPDARFPATLPTASATNLTSIPAGNLTGTVADARISALTASKLTGALPAISGANLTDLDAADLASGTIPDARFPATLPAASAANLTAIPAANITGTLPAISATNLTNIPAANITGTLPAIDGSALTGVASTTGGGAIYENSATISASRTIPSGSNGMSAGPIAVADGVTLTVSSGSVYTVV